MTYTDSVVSCDLSDLDTHFCDVSFSIQVSSVNNGTSFAVLAEGTVRVHTECLTLENLQGD